MSFNQFDLPKALLDTLAQLKYEQPTPIQEAAIPAIQSGKDVLGIAQTGSGKTVSFALPTLVNLSKSTALENRHVKVLVLVPTRELAVQVHAVFQQFGRAMEQPIKSLAAFGGVSINPQMIALRNVAVLVATPGRLLDLIEQNALYLDQVETLILDEADKLLNRSFQEELNGVLALLPKKRQNLLFSATLSKTVIELEKVLLDEPVVIKIEPKSTNLELIQQSSYLVTDARKGPFLRYLIKTKDFKQILIFVSSIRSADNVSKKLNRNGVKSFAIHSKKTQGARTEALAKFKAGVVQVLVATDLLSRGIDIKDLPCVINYELPRSPKDFIHRIGRTGRAEAVGDAITIVTKEDLPHFKTIQKKMKKWEQLQYTEGIDLHGF